VFRTIQGAVFYPMEQCNFPFVRTVAILISTGLGKERYKAEVAKYNQVVKTMKKGDKSLKKPVYDHKPLFIRCNCAKKIFSWFNGTCPNNCKDGSCDRCNCLCMFVCSTTNYNTVSIAVMVKKKSSTSSDDSAERIDHARQLLRGGDKIR